MTLSFKKRVIIPENVLIRELEGESVILNLDTENYYGLDDVGTRMWTVLTKSDTIQDAIDTLLIEYDVEPDRLRKDLNNLLEKLMEKGLVEVEGD